MVEKYGTEGYNPN
jgi:hypothetical protein